MPVFLLHFRIGRRLTLVGLGLVLLLLRSVPVHARPIEFSEPANTNFNAKVSSLVTQPADLPTPEDLIAKPASLRGLRGHNYTMGIQAPPPLVVAPRKGHGAGLFEKDKDMMQMQPDKYLLNQLERETFKAAGFDDNENSAAAWAAWDPYKLRSSRRKPNNGDFRDRSQTTNEVDFASDPLKNSDPFAGFPNRSSFADSNPLLNNGTARNALPDLNRSDAETSFDSMDQKFQADRLEEFKKSLNLATPMQNPATTLRANPPSRNATGLVSDPGIFSPTPAANFGSPFGVPTVPTVRTAPVAPIAPMAPGQSSLTPSIYTPPTKIEPVQVTAPRRVF